MQYGCQAVILKVTYLKIDRVLPMTTINMHIKFETEIPKQTWLMLLKPCRLPSLGGGIKIVFDQLYDYLITNGLLFESQYGFRKQHPLELAALELTDRICREMDQNRIPFSVFLDLSKAFDTLNHLYYN